MTAASDARGRTDPRFVDALSGPDGTRDPSVLMPVLPVYPDALSAPMPDAMVALPALDPAALARAALAARPAMPPSVAPVQPSRATRSVAQPGRYGRNPAPARSPSPRPTPDLRGTSAAHLPSAASLSASLSASSAASSTSAAWTGRTLSPSEVAGFLRNTFGGNAQAGITRATQQHQPQAHAPTPPLPSRLPRTTRRNKGSGVWAVFIFLVVLAFASGLGQRLIEAVSELFNR